MTTSTLRGSGGAPTLLRSDCPAHAIMTYILSEFVRQMVACLNHHVVPRHSHTFAVSSLPVHCLPLERRSLFVGRSKTFSAVTR